MVEGLGRGSGCLLYTLEELGMYQGCSRGHSHQLYNTAYKLGLLSDYLIKLCSKAWGLLVLHSKTTQDNHSFIQHSPAVGCTW